MHKEKKEEEEEEEEWKTYLHSSPAEQSGLPPQWGHCQPPARGTGTSQDQAHCYPWHTAPQCT